MKSDLRMGFRVFMLTFLFQRAVPIVFNRFWDAMRHASAPGTAAAGAGGDANLLGMRDASLDEFAERLRNVAICTSCRTDQKALLDSSGSSLFVSALVQGIAGKFGADKHKAEARVQVISKLCAASSQVTASSLLEFVALAVYRQNPSQKPFHLNADALSRDFPVSFL